MIVQLPSNGIFGLTQTVLNTPLVGHLSQLASTDYTEEQIRQEFVRMLLAHPEDLERMTICDRDYLFMIAASGVCMNQITTDFVCPVCKDGGKDVVSSVVYDITQQEVIELAPKTPSEVKKTWDDLGTEYTYRILRASDEERLVEYALADYDHYSLRYEQAFMAATLGQDCSDNEAIAKGIDVISQYPLAVYFSALLFTQVVFHGVRPSVMGKCRECGRDVKVLVPFGDTVKMLDSARLVNRFSQISHMVDFKSFLELSMPMLAQFEANARAQAK